MLKQEGERLVIGRIEEILVSISFYPSRTNIKKRTNIRDLVMYHFSSQKKLLVNINHVLE